MKILNMFNTLLNAVSQLADTAQNAEPKMEWHPEEALPMLKYLGVGMLSIIIIIGIIIIVTAIINKVFSKNKR